MTEKESLIEEVKKLSKQLNRDADTTGSIPDLKARIVELKTELDDINSTGGDSDNTEISLPNPTPKGQSVQSDERRVGIVPKITLHLQYAGEPLIAIKGKVCFVDAAQAQQVVEVEQLADYADE